MMARLLQVAVLLQWIVAAAFVLWAVRAGLTWPAALAVAACALIAVHGVPLAIEFITGALIDRRAAARLSPWRTLVLWWGETWISWRMFGIDMPFRSRFAEPPIVRDAGRPAVLLIHGFACNRAVWRPLLQSGRLAGANVATVNLEPPFGEIDDYADGIRDAVVKLRLATGCARVSLVCHSMGGLAARAYLRKHGIDFVDRVVTIATPHSGTVFARFGHGRNARQMRRGCEYLNGLGQCVTPYADRFVCIASRDDNLIVPRSSLLLPGARHIVLEGVGHLAMIASPQVHALVANELRLAVSDSPRLVETPSGG